MSAADTRVYERFRRWMIDAALPLWAGEGRDPDGYGFEERLTLAGVREDPGFKRVRVQARQIYVYSHASLLGWPGGLAAAAGGYDFLTHWGWRDDTGWGRRLGKRGGLLDPTADLYDIAFVLFAMAWYARASGSAEPIQWAHRTCDWLEANMASPQGGFLNALPSGPEPRRQNPHMHLLEAALALYETTGEGRFLGLARQLIALFRRVFFDRVTGTLGEVFDDDWNLPEGEASDHIEPGHHYEWTWLLCRYQKETGDDVSREASALYDFANTHGCDAETGLVFDVVDRHGNALDRSIRIWPHTEAIKAHIAMSRSIAPTVDALFDRFLDRSPTGAWDDHLGADGVPKSTDIPASSFYHLFMAFGEMARVFDGNPQGALS